MNDKVKVIKMNGSSVQADLICLLENLLTGRRFVFYTLNEVMGIEPNSTIKVYVSKVSQNNPVLDNPISDAEWGELKGIMGEILKGVKNPNLKYLTVDNPSISCISDKAIAMPISYDYINKHKSLYLESINGNSTTIEPASIINEPIVESVEPVVDSSVASEPIIETSTTNESGVLEPIIPSVGTINNSVDTNLRINDNTQLNQQALKLEPINITDIEHHYAQMFENLNRLKEQEIEAAKRYNATLELNQMHNEQHASYIASEQNEPASSIEPESVTPVILEPESEASSSSLETNWFDLPQN